MSTEFCTNITYIGGTSFAIQSVCLCLYLLLLAGLCYNVYYYLIKKKLYAVKLMTLMYVCIGITIVLKLAYNCYQFRYRFYDDAGLDIWQLSQMSFFLIGIILCTNMQEIIVSL